MSAPSATARPVSPVAAWFTLGILIATLLFAFMDRQVIALVAAPMAETLLLSDSQLGLAQGLGFAIFTVVAAYPLAWLADRIDRRLVLGLCVVIWASGTAACGLAQNFNQLFLAVIAIAAGEAGLAPVALSVVPDLFSGRQRVTANLVYYVASVLGVSLGLLLGGGAVAALEASHSTLPEVFRSLESWRLAFLLVAAPAPLFLVLIAFMRLRHSRPAHADVRTPAEVRIAPYLREHGRTFGLIIGGIAVSSIALGGLLAWMPVALARLYAITPQENGLYLGLGVGVGCIVGVLIAGLLMRRLSPRLGHRTALRIFWVSMVIAAPSVLVLPFLTAAWQAYVLVGVQMTLASLVGSLIPNVLQDLAPANLRARAMAIYTMIAAPIAGLSILAAGALSDAIGGPRSLLWALLIVSLPAWIISALMFRAAEQPFERTATWVNGQ